jgi:hypothetical protein
MCLGVKCAVTTLGQPEAASTADHATDLPCGARMSSLRLSQPDPITHPVLPHPPIATTRAKTHFVDYFTYFICNYTGDSHFGRRMHVSHCLSGPLR